MRKMKRMLAVMLAVLLVMGSLQVSVFAAQADGEDAVPETGHKVQETFEEEAEGSAEAGAVFTVTLDANGGSFFNEQDDVLQESFEAAEVINKLVMPGEAVAVFPVFRQGEAAFSFAGWSLVRDGELLTQGFEEYFPQGDCVLYAVWEPAEDVLSAEDPEEGSEEPEDVSGEFPEDFSGDFFGNAEEAFDAPQDVPGEFSEDFSGEFSGNAEEALDAAQGLEAVEGDVPGDVSGDGAGFSEDAEEAFDAAQGLQEDAGDVPGDVSGDGAGFSEDAEEAFDAAQGLQEDAGEVPGDVSGDGAGSSEDAEEAFDAAQDLQEDAGDAPEELSEDSDAFFEDPEDTDEASVDTEEVPEGAEEVSENAEGLSAEVQDPAEDAKEQIPEDAGAAEEEPAEDAGEQGSGNGEPVKGGGEDPAQGAGTRGGDAADAAGSGEPPLLIEDDGAQAASEEAAGAGGAAINVDVHSQDEIRAYVRNHPAPQVDNTYAVTPSATEPYVPGELSEESKQYAMNALNQVRYIAGVPADVSEDPSYTEKAQAASLTNAATGELTHEPAQPAGMDDGLYQLGYEGAQHSNIAWGSTNVPHSGAQSIVHSVLLWMSDSDSYNIDRVGHRRWMINPDMLYAGFGETDGYSAVYAHDDRRENGDYYGVAWPAQNMPVEYFNDDDAWSVSFGMALDSSAVDVTLIRTGDGAQWHFSGEDQSGGFFNVENSNYGQQGCVIFRPDGVSYSAGDTFAVSIAGVGASPVTYTVDFFSLCGGDHEYTSEVVSAPTCTERGETRKICAGCGAVQYEYTPANGHGYQAGELQDGLVTMTCEECGDETTGSVPRSLRVYWRAAGSEGSYWSSPPSGLEKGMAVEYLVKVESYTADSDTHFDDIVVETHSPEKCEITAGAGKTGSIVFLDAGTFSFTFSSKYNPGARFTGSIRVVKELESVTLTTTMHAPYRYGEGGVPLSVNVNGGKGTLKYTLVLLKEDGTEKVLASDQSGISGSFSPKSKGISRLCVDVKDTGDGDRIVRSNVLELEFLPGLVRVKDGKTITAAGALTYGQTLAELAVNNAAFASGWFGSEDLEGTFAFDEPDLVLPAGKHRASWTFTPDNENYETLSGSLQVTVNKAVPVITEEPSAEETVYHPQRKLEDVTLAGGAASVPGSWVWAEKDTSLQVPGGTYVCRFVPDDTLNYESVESEIEVMVSRAVPHIASLTPAAVTYGETLADSQLTGAAQYGSEDDTAVGGTFRWADETARPAVSDSEKTLYAVVFTPEDIANYKEVTTETQITVQKAQHPQQMPPEQIGVPFSTEKVSDGILRDREIDSWSFAEDHLEKDLLTEEPNVLTLVYIGEDAGNYETESVQITVVRSSCEHDGGTYVLHAKEASCTEEGVTGDIYCEICDELLESGTVIPAKGHAWDGGAVTQAPTLESEGLRTLTCTVCDTEKTESIAKLIDLSGAQVGNFREEMSYTGAPVTQSPVIKLGDVELAEGTDYSVSYSDNLDTGTATMTVEGIGLYGGSLTRTFSIVPADHYAFTEGLKVLNVVSRTYNGKAQTQSPTIKINGKTLEKNRDYTLSYKNNINAGKATMTITFIRNLTGFIDWGFTINPASVKNADVTGIRDRTYTGKAQTQSLTVKIGSTTLKKDTDYTLSYKNNVKAGTATVTITGKGNYKDSLNKTFKIDQASVKNADVTGIKDKTYTGKAQTQSPTVKIGSTTLKKDTDYTLSYKNNVKAGTSTMTITGKGNYKDSLDKTFKIGRVSVTGATVTGISAKVWNGSARTQSPVVKIGSVTLKSGTDYSLTYANNKNVGTATVTIAGKGNYTGSVKKAFLINPKPTSITSLKSGIVRFTAVWQKQTSQTTGYHIQWSADKTFKKDVRMVGVPSGKITKRTVVGGMRSGKTYYVRIRTYKVTGGRTYYSTWSSARSVRVK